MCSWVKLGNTEATEVLPAFGVLSACQGSCLTPTSSCRRDNEQLCAQAMGSPRFWVCCSEPPDAESREKVSDEHSADWTTAGAVAGYLACWLLWTAV